jgi:predicted aspartyl protease
VPPAPAASDLLQEIEVQAPEPRYVAPTLRDRIGRIWAPVYINGKGPFRLVLDTGASSSAVTAEVAESLGIPLDQSAPVMLRGVTGSAKVPTIRVESVLVGDLMVNAAVLPIVPDALGGAEGVLGTQGLSDKRIFIDFLHDRITISRSHYYQAQRGFIVVPLQISHDNLLVAKAYVGSVPVKAIIDTGGQVSIANRALEEAMARRRREQAQRVEIIGTTDDVQIGDGIPLPNIQLGKLVIRGAHVTMGDMRIFEQWKLTTEPVILIGMDTLGLLDTLIIDYRRRELQIQMHSG